jgi:hypothetical protein
MDNTSSTPRIIPVIITEEWCPKGTLAQVFQEYQDQWLSNAGVVIPGFGAVSPATLAQLQADIAALQSQVAENTKAYQTGTGSIAAGDSTVTVSFGTPMPDADYDIFVYMIDSTGAAIVAQSFAISGSPAPSATGFSIRFLDITATVNAFRWSVRQR